MASNAQGNAITLNELELRFAGFGGRPVPPKEGLVAMYDQIGRQTSSMSSSAQYVSGPLDRNNPMSAEKRARLELSRKRIPCYLFRVFDSNSGGGGEEYLNCKCGVCPHAALDKNMHASIYDINEVALARMLNAHLCSGTGDRSEVTSWAASLGPALEIGKKGEGCRIAVVDTHRLASHDYPIPPEVFHVPQLWRAGFANCTYTHEYHIHGVVKGRGSDFFSMTYDRDAQCAVNKFRYPGHSNQPSDNIEVYTKEAMDIASPFLKRNTGIDCGVFIYTVAMLIGLRFRWYRLDIFEQHVDSIAKTIMNDQRIATDPSVRQMKALWRRDDCIMTDLVFSLDHPDIKLGVRIVRYIALMP